MPKATPEKVTPEKEESAVKFRTALEELEAILRRIEGEEIDIDELGTELQRATQLLETCRTKIRKAELEVEQILTAMRGE